MYFRWALAGIFLLGGCVAPQQDEMARLPASVVGNARCSGEELAVDTNFPAGALESCTLQSSDRVVIRIAPENAPPINCSPWYTFRVTPAQAGPIGITLN